MGGSSGFVTLCTAVPRKHGGLDPWERMEAPYLTRVRVGSFLPPLYGLIPELYAHANATVTGYASAHAFPYNGAILLAMRRRRRAPKTHP